MSAPNESPYPQQSIDQPPQQHQKRRRKWPWVLGGLVGLFIVIGVATGEDEDSGPNVSADSGTSEQEVVVQETSATEPETSEQLVEAEPTTVEQPAEPQLPPQVQQAVRSAESYLEFSAFSKEGLIQQLSSPAGEGYPKDVAIQAVDTLDVDWNEQAAESAQNYLEYSAFSCTGLIQQLSSSAGEQFTEEQATYGAHQTDACA